MSRSKRSDVFDPHVVGVYHCFNRIVRSSFLCGYDESSGKDYSHRRDWLYERLKYFAGYFAIDVLAYAVLSNHYHVALRNRPDQVKAMSDRQVVTAWLMICPHSQGRKQKQPKEKFQTPPPPTEAEIQFELSRPGWVAELRSRLSNPSWMLRQLDQYMGMRCNTEDDMSGHFWEGRFAMKRLLDDAAVLACLAYVDLNPLRGGMTQSLEAYPHVSIGERLRTLDGGAIDASSWLAPIALEGETDGKPVEVVNRLSREEVAERLEAQAERPLGCLPMKLEQYAELLRWLAANGQPAPRKAGSEGPPNSDQPNSDQPNSDQPDSKPQASPEVPEILVQMGLDPVEFSDVVEHFAKRFYTAVGCPASLRREAERRGGRRRLNGPGRHALTRRQRPAVVS